MKGRVLALVCSFCLPVVLCAGCGNNDADHVDQTRIQHSVRFNDTRFSNDAEMLETNQRTSRDTYSRMGVDETPDITGYGIAGAGYAPARGYRP